MEERLIHHEIVFIPDHETTEVTEPCERAFDDVTLRVELGQRSGILEGTSLPVLPIRCDQFDVSLQKPLAKRIAVGRPIVDDTLGFHARPSRATARHGDCVQGLFDEFDFRGGRRVQEVSHRNTLAVDHHHPLRSLAAFGLSDGGAPFFAEAKLPSANVLDQSSCPRSSSSARKARQILSHNPCSSHRLNLRQQVLGLGSVSGRSRQRAPVLSTHRIPSRTDRLSAQGRPPLRVFGRSGRSGSIFSQARSDKSGSCFLAIGYPPGLTHITKTRKKLVGYETTCRSAHIANWELVRLIRRKRLLMCRWSLNSYLFTNK